MSSNRNSGLSLLAQYESSSDSADSSDSELARSTFNKYRNKLDSSDSDNDLDLDSDGEGSCAASTVGTESVCSETGNIRQRKPKKVTDPYPEEGLPPVEDLHISVPKEVCEPIGFIKHFIEIGSIVVVESYPGRAPVNFDTVLFVDGGERVLGEVFDVFGPVKNPYYSIRFNSEEHLKSANLELNMTVFCAPKTPYTKYVFMRDVLANKGSDASWVDDKETPEDHVEYSDDEKERMSKKKNFQNRKRKASQTDK